MTHLHHCDRCLAEYEPKDLTNCPWAAPDPDRTKTYLLCTFCFEEEGAAHAPGATRIDEEE